MKEPSFSPRQLHSQTQNMCPTARQHTTRKRTLSKVLRLNPFSRVPVTAQRAKALSVDPRLVHSFCEVRSLIDYRKWSLSW